MQPRSTSIASLVILGAACVAVGAWSAVQPQSRPEEAALVAHRYHAGQTPAVRKEVEAQTTAALEARRDLARTEFSEVLPVPSPRGLLLARTFLDAAGGRLRARALDSCEMTDTHVDCPTHYLTPQYPRIYLRLRYTYNQLEVELELRATHRGLDGQSTAAQARLSLEDAEWYQSLFLRLVDLTMARK